jgi:hypothetical protein
MAALTTQDLSEALSISPAKVHYLVTHGLVSADKDLSIGAHGRLRFTSGAIEEAERSLSEMTWLVSVTPDNWRVLCEHDLEFTPLPKSRIGWAQMLRPGSGIIFYVTRFSAFAGYCEVTGSLKKERIVWPGGVFSMKVNLIPKIVLPPQMGVKIVPMVEDLSFISKKKHWEMYIRSALSPLPSEDFQRIAAAIEAASKRVHDDPDPNGNADGSK